MFRTRDEKRKPSNILPEQQHIRTLRKSAEISARGRSERLSRLAAVFAVACAIRPGGSKSLDVEFRPLAAPHGRSHSRVSQLRTKQTEAGERGARFSFQNKLGLSFPTWGSSYRVDGAAVSFSTT